MAETRSRRLPIVGLVAWTLFVWLTRVRNVFGDDDLGFGDRIVGFLLAASFVVLACHVLWALTRRRDRLGWAVVALAAWTVVVWAVRGVGIATGDHSVGFVVVHLTLGAISVALAVVAVRAVARFRDGFSVSAAGR